jgi:hypothetical protein
MINIYQDVDGVLSPFSKGAPRTNTMWKGEWRTERIAGFDMLWSVELIDALKELDNREDVKFIWLTSWEDMAVEFFAPVVGIGADWPVLSSNDAQDDLKTWWKLRAIHEHIAATAPEKAVWLDDDINYDVGGKTFVQEMGDSLLAVNPNRNHGLTVKHLKRIQEFIDN